MPLPQSHVCPNCFQPLAGIGCPFCDIHSRITGQRVGQDATPLASPISTDTSLTTASTAMTPVSSDGTSAGTVQPASWNDFQLLYPFLWPTWLAGKIATGAIVDPSQESDSQTKRSQLGAVAQQLNTVISKCSSLPDADKTGWKAFAPTFIAWFTRDPGMFGTGDAAQAIAFQDQLRDWQIEVAKYCNIGMPILPKGSPTLAQLGDETLQTVQKYLDTFKWVLVVGAGLFIITVAVVGVGNTRRIVMKALA